MLDHLQLIQAAHARRFPILAFGYAGWRIVFQKFARMCAHTVLKGLEMCLAFKMLLQVPK